MSFPISITYIAYKPSNISDSFIGFVALDDSVSQLRWHPSPTHAATTIPNYFFSTSVISGNGNGQFSFNPLNPLDPNTASDLNPNDTYCVLSIVGIDLAGSAEAPIQFLVSSLIAANTIIHEIAISGTPTGVLTVTLFGIQEDSTGGLQLYVSSSSLTELSSLIANLPPRVTLEPSEKNLAPLIAGLVVGISCLFFIIIAVALLLVWLSIRKFEESIPSELDTIYSAENTMENDNKGFKNIHIEKKIGVGNFGEVYKGIWNQATPVALKKLKSDDIGFSEFEQEAQVLSSINNHINVVRFLGYYVGESSELYMVTEFLSDGSLDSILEAKQLPCFHKVHIIVGVISGMEFLHELNILHRDLGVRNILIRIENDLYIPKITDFGLVILFPFIVLSQTRFTNEILLILLNQSRFLEHTDYYKSQSATIPIRWSAPESLSRGKWAQPSDVYAFGVTCWEIFQDAQRPWPDISNKQVYQNVTTGLSLGKAPNMPDSLWEVLQECFKFAPKERPTFKELGVSLFPLLKMYEPVPLE